MTSQPQRPSGEESLSERRARALIEQEFGHEVERVLPSSDQATADYRSTNGGVVRSIEVKEITSAAHRELLNAFRKGGATAYDSTVLRKRWTVMVDLPTLSTILEPMPSFPPDDPELAASVETEFGGRMVTRSERQAEWRRTHPGAKRPATPRMRRLGRDLEPHLLVLEQHHIDTTRGRWPADPAASAALWAIAARTHGALCLAHDLIRDEQPGVDFALAAGSVRTGRADVLVDRIDLWMGSQEHSKNLLASLSSEPGAERHAVLVFDHHTEPEYHSAVEQGTAFCPSRQPTMPAEIDVLWFILGPIACRFSTDVGWQTMPMPNDTTATLSEAGSTARSPVSPT